MEEEWEDWDGGDYCPVAPPETLVEVEMLSGVKGVNRAGAWVWSKMEGAPKLRITRYRLAKR